jgi:protein MAK16
MSMQSPTAAVSAQRLEEPGEEAGAETDAEIFGRDEIVSAADDDPSEESDEDDEDEDEEDEDDEFDEDEEEGEDDEAEDEETDEP